MNDTDFKRSLREKAEKYELDAPEDLWAGIERKVKGRIFIRRFARAGAAAAVAALLVGLGIGLTRENLDTESIIAEVPVSESLGTQASNDALTTQAEPVPESGPAAETPSAPAKAVYGQVKPAGRASGKQTKAASGPGTIKVTEATSGTDTASEPDTEATEENQELETSVESGQMNKTQPVQEPDKSVTGKAPARPEKSQLTDNEYYKDAFREDDARRRHRSGGLSVRLLAANSSSVSLGMGRMDADAGFYDAPANALQPMNGISNDTSEEEGLIYSSDRIGDILIANLNEPVLNDEKHHRPLTFGVRVAFPLTDRLAVESGLNYSLLRSESSYGGSRASEEKRQSLHYLGIPLNLNYTLIHYRRLNFIVSAGVMAEKCVYGKTVTDYTMNGYKTRESKNLSVKGLQWSTGVSASLQYNFAKNLGLFVEPGLRYRYDNGKGGEVKSAYTDAPMDFSLAVGARINL